MWCDKLSQHVISRHGDAPWPAGSPDLSGCDCFLEGYVWREVNYAMANRGAPSNNMRRNLGDPSSNDLPHTGKPSVKSEAGLWGMAGGTGGIRSLGTVANLRKATVNFVMYIRLELGSQWTEFHETLYLSTFWKSVEKIKVLWSSKNNWQFSWRPLHIFDHISLTSS